MLVGQVEQAQRPARLPEGFTREEVRAVLGQMEGTPRLMAGLLYGSGLRSGTREAGGECVRLRVKDLDFACRQITLREGKGVEGPVDGIG
jgi:integrase